MRRCRVLSGLQTVTDRIRQLWVTMASRWPASLQAVLDYARIGKRRGIAQVAGIAAAILRRIRRIILPERVLGRDRSSAARLASPAGQSLYAPSSDFCVQFW